jgi:hypothetical protein
MGNIIVKYKEPELSPEQIKVKFLAIIDERLNSPRDGLIQELELLKVSPRTAHNMRRIVWIQNLIETNLKWQAVLQLGRFSSPSQLTNATR